MHYESTTLLEPMPAYERHLAIAGEWTAGDFTSLDDLTRARVSYLGRYADSPPKVRHDSEHNIEMFFEWCRWQRIQPLQIVKAQTSMYLHWLKQQGWSESTIATRWGNVCVFYSNCVDDEILLRDPTRGVKRPKIDKEKQHRPALTMLEMIRVLDAARQTSPDHLLLCSLMGQMALRLNEATQLRIENIDTRVGKPLVSFVGKNSKAATLEIPMPIFMAAQECIGSRPHGDFLRNSLRRKLTDGTAYTWVKDMTVKAGLDPREVSPHAFRRSAITIALDQGVDLLEVQRLARHENSATTLRYYRGNKSGSRASQHLSELFATMLGAA